jgi:outer membrane protein
MAAADEQVAASADAVTGAERELGFGTRSNTDVLNARQDLLDAQIVRLQAVARASIAAYALLASTGALSSGHFGLGQPEK